MPVSRAEIRLLMTRRKRCAKDAPLGDTFMLGEGRCDGGDFDPKYWGGKNDWRTIPILPEMPVETSWCKMW